MLSSDNSRRFRYTSIGVVFGVNHIGIELTTGSAVSAQKYLSSLSFKAFNSSSSAVSISGEVRCPSATLLTNDALTFNLRATLAYTPLKSEMMSAALAGRREVIFRHVSVGGRSVQTISAQCGDLQNDRS